MKRSGLLLVGSVVALLIAFLPTGVYAYTPPGQSTENATDIILWHGDTANVTANLTGSATITINDFEDALTAASEAGGQVIADELGTIYDSFIIFLFAFGIAVLGYSRGDRGLILLAGFAFLVEAWSVFSSSVSLTIIMALAGCFMIVRAFSSRREAN